MATSVTGPEVPDPFVAQVNSDLLYRDPSGHEAWAIFSAGKVTIVTDIHAQGAPYNAVAFDAATLRRIADMLDERQELQTSKG